MNEQETTESTPESNFKREAIRERLSQLNDTLRGQIIAASLRIALLEQHKDFFLETGINPSICNELIDFDFLEHEDIIKVIRHFGGKWKKEYAGGRVDYETTVGGIRMRCFHGNPPPNCKVVEYEETVPEHVVPAQIVKKKRLQCTESVTPQTIES